MHHPRKRFGQNFLQDNFIVEQIISVIHPVLGDHLVEIGPGLGSLTIPILPMVKKMDVIEFDRDIIPKLEVACKNLGELIIHQADALTFDFSSLMQNTLDIESRNDGVLDPGYFASRNSGMTGRELAQKLRVFGNLPYNISTPLLFHLIDHLDCIQDMHFMLQKEVVDRICANVKTKDYGRLSVMLQYYCEVEKLFDVPPTAFQPIPNVHSAFIRLIPKKERAICDAEKLSALVKQSFAHRRKTLKNNLKDLISVSEMEKLNINPGARPEEITVEHYVSLSKIY